MDREKAIKILALFREEWDRHSKTPNAKALDMAIEALQEQERKWIPVSERLPEDEYGVLATVNGKHNNTTFIDALEIAEYDSDEGWIIEGYLDWINPDVTAWMPLPEPYKESEEE